MATFKGKLADIYLGSGAPVAFTAEATTADASRTVYSITNLVKRAWDDTQTNTASLVPVLVERSIDSGASWQTVVLGAGDRIAAASGQVRFAAARAVGELIRVGGFYLAMARAAQGRTWTFDLHRVELDATVFQADWTAWVADVGGGAGQLDLLYQDSTLWALLVAGAKVALALYVDATSQPAGPRYEGYALLKKDTRKVAPRKLDEETIAFTFTGTPTYVAA